MKSQRIWALLPPLVLFFLAVAIAVLYLSEQRGWFWFSQRKGYTVLLAFAVSSIGLFVLFGSSLVSQFTKWKLQFSLATLMWMVPVAGVPCAWMAREVRQASRQREAVDAIEQRDGQVHFDKRDHHAIILNGAMPILGRTFFDDVEKVHLDFWSDDDLVCLKQFSNLKELTIFGSDGKRLTDAGLEQLSEVTQLRHLGLLETNVTARALGRLKVLPQLNYLSVRSGNISDADLNHLMELKQLTTLCIYTGITEEGLSRLQAALPNCAVGDGAHRCD